ncbi:OPA3-like protein-like [Planoprotostelium fungivorum]|uniref:OPA3-like protein-like n=1 Tax=Planoprotostelium fungivorum TaxID=1890364 RepID=A0A2P6NGL7_9EUKA|nr:OPA3-like protein-like [Planoprotostelium fungivorum]
MVLPLIKLGSLFIKTLSKPVANSIKQYAKTSPVFRKGCLRSAQTYHNFELSLKRRMLGLKEEELMAIPISGEKAVVLCADMLGEAIVFTIAVLIVVFETARSKASETAKKEELNSQLVDMKSRLIELETKFKLLEQQREGTDPQQQQQEALNTIQKGTEGKDGPKTLWKSLRFGSKSQS